MRDLILKALRDSVKAYPELKAYLSDDAKTLVWIAEYKLGEAPDDEQRRKDERKIERKFKAFLEDQKARILTYVRTHDMKGIQPSFWDDEEKKLWAMLGEDFVGILLHGVEGGLEMLPGGGTGAPVDQDRINMQIVKWGRQYRDKWLSKIEETTRQYVEQKITNWSLSGDPLPVLINALKEDTTGVFAPHRAKRVAVTETTRLHAMGNQAAWEETGYIREFRWNTANDELVCPICKGHHGKKYPIEQMGEMIPAHVNCRCWGSPIVSEELEEAGAEMVLGPSGIPVSGALDIPNGYSWQSYRDAMDAIDRVHGDGNLPNIPMKETRSTRKWGEYQYYRSGHAVQISVNKKGPHPLTTLAHEIGHFIDHQALGKSGEFESSFNTDIMKGWFEAVKSSDAYKTLTDMRGKSEIEVEHNGKTSLVPIGRKYVSYLRNRNELWARSYAQYIAEKSGNTTMLDEINGIINNSVYPMQWQTEDFAPIKNAIDDMFKGLGWIQ